MMQHLRHLQTNNNNNSNNSNNDNNNNNWLNLLLRWYCQRLWSDSIGGVAADFTSEWGITSLLMEFI